MRKIDKAFSNSLKAPSNVIPIQGVLLVRIEPLARYRPHAILALRDNAYLSSGAPLFCPVQFPLPIRLPAKPPQADEPTHVEQNSILG